MLSWAKSRLGLQRIGLKEGAKVDFLICGAQKSGTSALNKYLATHRSICMADKKEVHYCNTCENRCNFTKVEIPYACKLLFQELITMNIAPRIITE